MTICTDISFIEHIGYILKTVVFNCHPNSKLELKDFVRSIRAVVDKNNCEYLVRSMHDRITAIVKEKDIPRGISHGFLLNIPNLFLGKHLIS